MSRSADSSASIIVRLVCVPLSPARKPNSDGKSITCIYAGKFAGERLKCQYKSHMDGRFLPRGIPRVWRLTEAPMPISWTVDEEALNGPKAFNTKARALFLPQDRSSQLSCSGMAFERQRAGASGGAYFFR